MEEKKEGMKARIFVSYSRKDSIPARKLINAFKEMKYDVWVDWEDIPPAARWMDKIKEGIERSDAFIFLISPASIKSEVCNVEIEHAAKYNKRIVPIVLKDVPAKETNNNIRQLNWIFIRKADEFKPGLERFRDAMELDFEWVAEHNKLLEKTLDWHHRKTDDYLLRGAELRRVQSAVETAKNKQPKLTDLQKMFLDASAKSEQRRITRGIMIAAVIAVLAGLTIFAVLQSNLARANEERATANAILANQQKAIAEKNAELAIKNAREARNAQLEAEKQQKIAEERRLLAEDRARIALAQQSAARAQIYQTQPGGLYISTLLAIASWTTSPSDEANAILRKNISLLPIPRGQIQREGSINALVFHPQGDWFVTAEAGSNACVWNASEGELLFCINSPRSVEDAVFSPNGEYLVTGDESGLVQIVDLESRAVSATYQAGAAINDLDVRRESDLIAVTSDDRKITVIDTAGKVKFPLLSLERLLVASFSPDGRYVASGSSGGTVTLWRLTDGGSPISKARHRRDILSMAFSPDGKFLVTGGVDGYAVVTRVSTGEEVYRRLHEDWVTDIAFSADGAWFATVSADKRIRLWDTADGEERLRMSQDGGITEVRISANGQWIATTGADRTVRVWNVSTGAEMFQIPLSGEGSALGFNRDGSVLAAGDAAGEIGLWDISVVPVSQTFLQFDAATGGVQYSPSGEWMTASAGPQVWLLKPGQFASPTSRLLTNPSLALNGDVASLTFSPDSVWLGVATVNGGVLVYNLQTRQPRTIISSGLEHQIAFASDSGSLITSASNGAVEVWSLSSFAKTADWAAEGSGVTSLAVGPSRIALGVTDAINLLTPAGEAAEKLESPGDHTLLAFSADGSLLASSNSAGLIEIWRQENGAFVRTGSIRRDAVHSLAFNPEGTRLAVGTATALYLIDPFTAEETTRIPHSGSVEGVAYSPDGSTVATASQRTLQFWAVGALEEIRSDGLVTAACMRLTANFSPAQWSNLFGAEAYRVLCEQLPIP
jgi:WD40 repeat protein